MNIKNRYIFNQMAVAKGWLIKTFLLLLLLFVACGEPDDMFGTIHGDDEEIELTINTLLPDGGISTRTAPTENITSITALAFDRNHELIKVQSSVVVQPTTSNTTGIFKVTVPQRTRRIHFIAKNNGEFAEITESDYGKTDVGLLVNRISSIQNSQDADGISNALHYWQMLDFESAEDLKDLSDELQALDKKPGDGYQLPLIRNMAKITLNLQDGMTGHIAGILNYNTTGTIVPYLKDGNNYTFKYQNTTNHELPSTFVITSDVSNCSELGTVHYLFEEYDDVGDLIYVMCYIDNDGESGNEAGHFYKVALVKPTFTGVEDKYYYVIRNQAYNINIVGELDVTLGKTDYSDAVQNAKPINDSQKEQVHLDIEPDELNMYIGETGKVIVKIPAGISQFQIGYLIDKFNEGGVFIEGITPTNREVSADGSIYIDTYDATTLGTEFELSVKLKESIKDAISGMEIQFKGTGESKRIDDKLIVNVLKKGVLNVTPTALDIPKTKGSNFSVKVFIPSYDNYDGAYELKVTDEKNKYNITAPGELVLNQNGTYNVEKGQTYTFIFELREDGQVGDEHTIKFYLDTDFNDDSGTTTVTLIDNVVHDQDYEIWVDNSAWTGTENSVTFFGYNKETPQGSFTNGTTPNGFRTEFYDTGANSHISQSMVMGSDDSFTFTIPEGENRYLTMLVAANGGNPNINLTGSLSDGSSWATGYSNATVVPSNYNFGNGEIGSAGRLIRYELAPGTYTLKGSDAAYLLYYMRLTREKPVMTDVAQPLITDYELSWSGATYVNTDANGNLKINDSKYIVDQDNLNHTVILKSENNSLASSLNLSTFTLSEIDVQLATKVIAFQATNSNDLKITENNQGKSAQSNTCTLDTYNAGNYATSGTINEPDYKYEVFYEKLHLNSVQYEVKSPIIPGLYTSMKGDKLTPVNGFTNLDEAWAIGFLMPKVVPDLVVSPENYTIDISIPGWTISDDGDARGLGVEEIEKNAIYRLQKQSSSNDNNNVMYHPREGWTYKIKWANIAGEKIVPSLTGEEANDTDHYFIYNGTIAKAVEIPTPYTEQKLDVTLNFRSASENKGNGEIYNLNFGNDFYLTAQISQADAQNYVGKMVRLKVDFSNTQGGGNNAIHWTDSRKDGSIEYGKSDGTILQFEIKQGQTSYDIHWQFARSNSDTGEVRFTYTIGGQNVSGEPQTTIVLNGNVQAVDNPLDIALDFYSESENRSDNNYSNLALNSSHFFLKATISSEDAQQYKGETIQLKGDFPSINGAYSGWAMQWADSRQQSSTISYTGPNYNGQGLQFKIDENNPQTTYLIEWVFKHSGNTNNYPGYGDIAFTYTISNVDGKNYNITGDTQATIAFTNEPTNNGQILVTTNGQSEVSTASLSLDYSQNSSEEFTVDVTVPAGVTQLNIQAADFDVSWVNGNNSVSSSTSSSTSITTNGGETMRLKFALKSGSHNDKNSTITFSGNNNVSSATVNVDLSPRASESSGVTTIWNGWAQLNWADGINYLSTGYQIPVGSVVTLNFTTTGGSIKLHDVNGGANIIVLPGRDYGNNDNLGIIPVNSGDTSFSFNVTNEIKVNNQNINGHLNGLKINGENVILTSIVVSTSGTSMNTLEYDFENGQRIDGWNNVTTSIVYDNIAQSNVLRIEMQQNDNNWGQLGIGDGNYSGKYKLFLKFKKGSSSSSGTMKLAFQDSSNNYEKRATIDLSLSANADDSWHSIEQDVTLSGFADQFVILLEGVNGGTVIYIDDLKLVRTN